MRARAKGGSLFLLSLLLPAICSAQAVGNQRERAADRRQIAAGREALERDERELAEIGEAVGQLDAARQGGDEERFREVHARLLPLLRREAEQAQARVAQAEREVRQGRRELRGDRREIRGDRDEVDEARRPAAEDEAEEELRRDQINRLDDRRDVRDDRTDLDRARARSERQAAIVEELTSRSGSLTLADAKNTGHQVELAREFVKLLEQEVELTRRELAEDRGERREDRRERRQDRDR